MLLDAKENLLISDDETDAHYEELMALNRMGAGLWWLYRFVEGWEVKIQREAETDDIQLALAGGILENKPVELLSCAFQWYAISACSYSQLVGWLATGDPKSAKEYVRRVMPRISNYRNKIAAHLALTDPRDDNEADVAASVMTQIIYCLGRVFAASLTPVFNDTGTEITVSRDLSWSLTVAHQQLAPRYWPDGPTKAFQSLRVPPGTTTLQVNWSALFEGGT